jgi:predicted PurR-regulated permease PerM
MASPAKSVAASGTRYILIALALLAVALVLWRVGSVVVVAFGGIVVGTLLRAMAHPLRRFSKLSDHVRVGLALAVLVLLVAGIGWIFGRQISGEANELRRLLPQQTANLAAWLNRSAFGRTLVDSIHQTVKDSKTLGGIGAMAFTVLGGGLDALLILFLGVYLALDPKFYLEGALRLLPLRQRDHVRRALLEAGNALRQWLVAQLAAMVIIGVLVGAVLGVLGVPLAFVLGALAAILEFIPVVGAILFGIPGILVAFSKGPHLAAYTLVAYLVIQQMESNIIIPLLQRWAVEMPPVVSLLAVLVAGILFGPAGIIFAAPLAVVSMALVNHLYVEDVLEHPAKK